MVLHPDALDLRIELLGHFQITLGATVVDERHWRKQKPRQLLALLLCTPHGRLPRTDVCAALWPEHPNPGNNLHVTIHHLRKLWDELPAQLVDITLSAEQVILTLPPNAWVDVLEFERQAHELQSQPFDSGRYREVLALYHGPLLPDDEYELWTMGRREHLAQLFAQLAITYADQLVRQDPQAAEVSLQQLIGYDPTHESAAVRLMLLAQRKGQRATANRIYESLRDQLAQRLDLPPMPSTEQIAAACRNDTVAQLPLQEWGLQEYRQRHQIPLPFAASPTAPLGREAELAQVLAIGATVATGRGMAVGVGSVAGMGKLRLVQTALTRLHQQDWIIIAGAPLSNDHTLPYESLIEGLGEYLRWSPPLALDNLAEAALMHVMGPAVPPALRPASEPPRLESQSLLFLGLTRVFEAIAAHAPLALFIDDAHHADPDTLEFLVFLMRRIRTQRMLLLLTYRPDDVDPSHPLLVYWQELVRSGTSEVIKLGPLMPAICTALLSKIAPNLQPDVAARLIERSDGNPFFLSELARHVNESHPSDQAMSIPRTIVEAVQTRIGKLSPAAKAVLEVGSVATPFWQIGLVERVQHMAPSVIEKALEELIGAHLVRETADGLRITRSLVQEVIYKHLFSTRRARIHTAVADSLINHDSVAPAIVLHHLLNGEASPEQGGLIVRYGLQAAKHALTMLADDDARRSFVHVLSALEKYGGAPAAWLEALFGLATIEFRHGMYPETRSLCDQAARWTQDNSVAESERLTRLGWVEYRLSNVQACLDSFTQGVALAPPASTLWCDGMSGQAVVHYLQGHISTARAIIDQTLPYFDEHQPSISQARSLFLAGSLANELGEKERAAQLHRRGIACAEASGDVLYTTLIKTNYAIVLIRRGELAAALEYIREALQVSSELGNRDYESIAYSLQFWCLLVMGQFTPALEVFERALIIVKEVNNIEMNVDILNMRAMLARVQHDWQTAACVLQQSLSLLGDEPYSRSRTDTYVELVRLTLYGPELDIAQAARYAQKAFEEAHKSEHKEALALSLIARSAALTAQGQFVQAAAIAYEGIAIAKRQNAILTLLEGYISLARTALASHDLVLARTELEKAKLLAVKHESAFHYAEIVEVGATLEARQQHSLESRETIDYNEDWLAPILAGQQTLAERARGLGVKRAVLRRVYLRYNQHLASFNPPSLIKPNLT
ncbi:MAG: AAA family ATPase [Herpetosiphonaceae bacterium]|nr:AAA family ATPase [Herpetosiphonaceae bacterium]